MSNAEQDYYAEIVELRAELERVRRERDQYIERCEELQTVQLRMVEELAKVEGEARIAREERDAARAAAAAWKQKSWQWREIAVLVEDYYRFGGSTDEFESAIDMYREMK